MERPVRVLVVDDSAFMRRVITQLLASDPDIAVVGTARDGQEAVEKVLALKPDVVTLDIEMPRLDGYGALQELMARAPVPVVMVSSQTQAGAEATIRALTLGAVDFVAKPSGPISLDMDRVRDELVLKVKAATRAQVRPRRVLAELPPVRRDPPPGAGPAARGSGTGGREPQEGPPPCLVVIGCSTGGPGALHQVIPRLPGGLDAAVVVVQHMPPGFTRSLAGRLDGLAALRVKEAEDGDRLRRGLALVAPGGRHLVVAGPDHVRLTDDPPQHGVRPAVDPTLESAARHFGSRLLAVILTGMGFDGSRGALAVRRAGGRCVAEHPSTCVVYGMPRAVVEMGLADQVLPVHDIPAAIVRFVQEAGGVAGPP